MNNLTLGSLFDGSGGFPLGGLLAGITPVWASEIEPFPIRVTTKRLPFMKHYGNVSEMDGGKVEPVDIITFGSPCQDMSVAGKRAGLEGSRSNLFYEAVRIIKEMRKATGGEYPKWACWENVPGAFYSSGGEDFRCVLESLCGVIDESVSIPKPKKWANAGEILGDGYSLAWRVLDAQSWGVPQRRKRIYLVADFTGGCAGKVLFESEGLSGYSPQGFRSWQTAPGYSANCSGTAGIGFDGHNAKLTDDKSATLGVNCEISTGRSGVVLNDQGGNRMDVTEDVTCTLHAEAHHPPCVLEETVALENHPMDGRVKLEENGKVQTLSERMGTGGNNVPLVLKIRSGCEGGGKGPLIQTDKSATLSCNNDQTLFEPKAYGICSKESNAMKSSNPHSGIYEADTSRTIDTSGGNPACNQGGIAVVAFAQNQRDEVRDLGEKSACLSAEPGMKQQTYVLQGNMIGRSDGNGPQGDGINEDVSFTLNTVDRHAVYAMPTGNFTQVAEDKAPTVLAHDYKDPNAVCMGRGYTVRRLTPTECARLQGFPDWWCDDLGIEPTTEDLRYWYDVFETHRRIVGSSKKPKSLKQIAKWLRDPHSDAAEYKMWGNGVALPCVVFVLSGIVYCTQSEIPFSKIDEVGAGMYKGGKITRAERHAIK